METPATIGQWRNRIRGLRWVKASELGAHPDNWRRHPKWQEDALRGVLQEVGFAGALLAYETEGGKLRLVDGHLRQGMAGAAEVPVLVLDLDEAEARKLLAVYDPLSAMAQADQDRLVALLGSIQYQDEAVNEMLEALANGETAPMPYPAEDLGAQIDKAEALREKWDVKYGQYWEIGRHRLLCGDATKQEDHQQLLQGVKVNLVLTDPPYGVGIEYGDFQDSPENVIALIQRFLPLCLKWPAVLITSGHRLLWEYPKPSWLLAWVSPMRSGMNPWGFTYLHPVLAYGKDPYLAEGKGCRPDTLILAGDRGEVEGHPAVKPLDVWKWLMERGSANVGEVVLDPFIGSGTTMVAAEQLGRICYGLEIEPKYVAVTLERMLGMKLKPRLVNG